MPTSNSLEELRRHISSLQASTTCTSIQHSRLASLNHNNEILMNTIGMACILNAFQEASMLYTYTNGYFGEKKTKLAQQALAFIQGTGLEVTLISYGLEYNANELRSTFFRVFHVKS